MINLNTWLKHLTRRKRKMKRSLLRRWSPYKRKSSNMILTILDLKSMKDTTWNKRLLIVLRVFTALSHQDILLACKIRKHHHYLSGTIILELLAKSFKLHLWHLIDRLKKPYLEQTQRRSLSATSSSSAQSNLWERSCLEQEWRLEELWLRLEIYLSGSTSLRSRLSQTMTSSRQADLLWKTWLVDRLRSTKASEWSTAKNIHIREELSETGTVLLDQFPNW